MDDPAAMRIAQRLQHLARVAQRFFERQAGRKPPPQVFALDAFHDHHQLLRHGGRRCAEWRYSGDAASPADGSRAQNGPSSPAPAVPERRSPHEAASSPPCDRRSCGGRDTPRPCRHSRECLRFRSRPHGFPVSMPSQQLYHAPYAREISDLLAHSMRRASIGSTRPHGGQVSTPLQGRKDIRTRIATPRTRGRSGLHHKADAPARCPRAGRVVCRCKAPPQSARALRLSTMLTTFRDWRREPSGCQFRWCGGSRYTQSRRKVQPSQHQRQQAEEAGKPSHEPLLIELNRDLLAVALHAIQSQIRVDAGENLAERFS